MVTKLAINGGTPVCMTTPLILGRSARSAEDVITAVRKVLQVNQRL